MPNIQQQIESVLKFSKFWTFSTDFMRSLGEKAIRMIQQDSRNGMLQDPLRDTYKSAEYMRRKARRFNRLDGKGKIAGFRGQMSSTRTDYVDMRLTGKLMKGLHVVKAQSTEKESGIEFAYNDEDMHKIVGNEMLGRSVRTLNEKNQEKVVRDIAREVGRNIGRAIQKDLHIIVEM